MFKKRRDRKLLTNVSHYPSHSYQIHEWKVIPRKVRKYEIRIFNEMAKFLFLILIVILFTSWLYFLHQLAPSLDFVGPVDAELKFPSNLKELQDVAFILKSYSVNHKWYVLLIFSSAYIYKQSFCIPGSIFLNLLAGALYGQVGGLFFACLFTAIGASMCYLISQTFAKELVHHYFPKYIASFQEKIKKNEDNLLYFMLLIRLVPVTPGWVINVVAPLVDVPFLIFFITTFFGLGPYNFVGVSAGGMLASLKSVNDVFTWRVLLNITLIGLAAYFPAYFLKRLSSQSSKISLKTS